MRVLVLGATGGTGRRIVGQARAAGHDMVALVRSAARARELDGLEGAALVEGDARDPQALRRALAGVDAVVSALGTPLSPLREVTLLSTATRALVEAMRQEGARRLVVITGMGAGDSRGHGGLLYDRLILPLLLRSVYRDKDRQEAIVRASGLDWVLVRPAVLNDKPARGAVRATTDLRGVQGGTVSRIDVARFVTAQLAGDEWLRQAPLIRW
jgi:uncharacterized protein YbjT (DUF2867 family)